MARQFDVVANPDADDAVRRPYLVILQSDLVSGLTSSIVAPLVRRELIQGANRLNPLVTIADHQYWLATHELFAIDSRMLRKPIGNLESERDAMIAALDLLFTGF